MIEYQQQIISDGGKWAHVEVLGNHAICKVLAAESTILQISSTDGFVRIPKDSLNDSLSELSANQKDFVKGKVLSLGYSIQEIRDKFGDDIGQYSVRDLIKFIASRRLRVRYDAKSDALIFDGPEQPVTPIEVIDERI